MSVIFNMSHHWRNNTCWVSIARIDHFSIHRCLWFLPFVVNFESFPFIVSMPIFHLHLNNIFNRSYSSSVMNVSHSIQNLEMISYWCRINWDIFLCKFIRNNLSTLVISTMNTVCSSGSLLCYDSWQPYSCYHKRENQHQHVNAYEEE